MFPVPRKGEAEQAFLYSRAAMGSRVRLLVAQAYIILNQHDDACGKPF